MGILESIGAVLCGVFLLFCGYIGIKETRFEHKYGWTYYIRMPFWLEKIQSVIFILLGIFLIYMAIT